MRLGDRPGRCLAIGACPGPPQPSRGVEADGILLSQNSRAIARHATEHCVHETTEARECAAVNEANRTVHGSMWRRTEKEQLGYSKPQRVTNCAPARRQFLRYKTVDYRVDLPKSPQGHRDEISGESPVPWLQLRESLVIRDGVVEGTMPLEHVGEEFERNLPRIRQWRPRSSKFAALRASTCYRSLSHPHGPWRGVTEVTSVAAIS